MHKIELEKALLPNIKSGRRVGNTTRLADWYIQELFKHKRIVVRDHYYNPTSFSGRNTQPSQMLFDIILSRLNIEHRWRADKNNIKIDRNKFIIELINR